ncbi:hypothetical protein [Pseudomonas sp.]|uniref:hypothetical protein n=1 Tax=Pseudomonas sp. TaxID=306 RepID=UPI0032DA3E17
MKARMAGYFRRLGTRFALLAAVPAIVGFVSSWSAGMGFLLFILAIPAAALILFTYALISLIRGVQLGRQVETPREKILAIAAAPFGLACTLALAWPSLAAGSFGGSLSRLIVNKSQYEAIIRKAQSHQKPDWFAEDEGVTYSVDVGPPVRVAFNPAGMLDNWSGIIYDPTGDVMLAKGFDSKSGRFFGPDRITKLFKGDLVRCRRLWGSYYDCSFT